MQELVRQAEAERAATEALASGKEGSLWKDTLRNIFRQRSAVVGASILGFLALVAIFASQLAPFDPITENFIGQPDGCSISPVAGKPTCLPARAAPCIHALGCAGYAVEALPDGRTTDGEHLMGLDGNFRDVYSRVLYGARISLPIGFASVGFAIIVGCLLGAIAGYAGGRIDNGIMRVMDVLLVFPALLLAIFIVTVLGKSLLNALIAIGLVSIPIYARIMRASVLSVREQDFVTASRALGARPVGILLRRVLPNSLTPIIVAGTLGIGTAVLDIAALSFLGLGADRSVPEWGAMIGLERDRIFSAPHLLFFPGLAITLTVLGFNLLGDGLRDALDPRLNR